MVKYLSIEHLTEPNATIIDICKQSDNPIIRKFASYYQTLLFYKAKLVFITYNENGETLGFLCYAICKNHLTMYAIATRNNCRGKGVGTKLFNQMIQDAKQLGKSKIKWKATSQSVGFYEKLGIKYKQKLNDDYVYELNVIPPKTLIQIFGETK